MKKWRRRRHALVTAIAQAILRPYSRLKYGITIEKFREQGKRNYLILYNHQTAFDQFFVGMAFRGPLYYVASEDLFSLGFVSSLLRYLVAPIPINKQTTDIRAVKNCLKVAREGGSVAIAPEGNRTFSGKTEYMSPSIAFLAKKLGLPIALYHIEGGFGVHPRWSDMVRKGKMRAHVSRVIEPKEYANLSHEELYALIKEGLSINEANERAVFKHKKRAEYIERVLYVCPHCGLSTFESHGARFACKKCGREAEYTETTALRGDFDFHFLNDWYEYQTQYLSSAMLEGELYRETARFSEVTLGKRKTVLEKEATVCLYADKLVVGEHAFPFSEIMTIAVLGKNKLNIYHGKKVYQLKGNKRFNAVKYVHIFYKSKGDSNGEFWGL